MSRSLVRRFRISTMGFAVALFYMQMSPIFTIASLCDVNQYVICFTLKAAPITPTSFLFRMDGLFCENFYDQCISLYEQLYELWTNKGRKIESIGDVVYVSLDECLENLQDQRNSSLIKRLANASLGRSVERDGTTLIRLRDMIIVLVCDQMQMSADALLENA